MKLCVNRGAFPVSFGGYTWVFEDGCRIRKGAIRAFCKETAWNDKNAPLIDIRGVDCSFL